jgi:DeoR/GlpR family transcriptional regulator of sugar metabolism
MIPAERRQQILEVINEKGTLSISELTDLFNVSEMTIHRDLKFLESTGRVEKTYGGVLARQALVETDFERRRLINTDAKRKIGKAAANLVNDGDSIIIDGSSTCLEMIPNLSIKKELTVFTTGVNASAQLINYPNIEMICTGGMVPRATNSYAGFITNQTLMNIHADICFLGAAGVSAPDGITDPFLPIAEMKKRSAAAANEVIILADRTKFGRISKFNALTFDQIDLIISDAEENTPCVKEIRDLKVEILLVE